MQRNKRIINIANYACTYLTRKQRVSVHMKALTVPTNNRRHARLCSSCVCVSEYILCAVVCVGGSTCVNVYGIWNRAQPITNIHIHTHSHNIYIPAQETASKRPDRGGPAACAAWARRRNPRAQQTRRSWGPLVTPHICDQQLYMHARTC